MIYNPQEKVFYDFKNMKVIDDFLNIMRFVSSYDKYLNVSNRYLLKYSDIEFNTKLYTEFEIVKKSGDLRKINAPHQRLKYLQKIISVIFQCIFEPHSNSLGFAINKSVVDNARLHVGKNYVFNIDLKDFFSNIDSSMILNCLINEPFNLNFSTNKYNILNYIISICCIRKEADISDVGLNVPLYIKNVLPQGAPSSPILSNIVCASLDRQLCHLAKKYNLQYSRYADDLTFSSMYNAYFYESEFQKDLGLIISDCGFAINERKTRLQKKKNRQEVTGIIVNEKINLRRKFSKDLRMWLYFWEKYGYDKANSYFLKKCNKDFTKSKDLKNVVQGRLSYLKMIIGQDNTAYLKLKDRFEKCTENLYNK